MKRSTYKIIKISAITLLLAVLIFAVVFSAQKFSRYEKINFNKSLFLLGYPKSSDEEYMAVIASSVYISGGAGYVFNTDKASKVIISCYYNENEATLISENLKKRGVENEILSYKIENLILKSHQDKRVKKLIESNLQVAFTCSQALYEIANKVDRGEYTQREARQVIGDVNKVLTGIYNSDINEKSLISSSCKEMVYLLEKSLSRTNEILNSIIYSKDIRYVSICLADLIIKSSINFVV